MFGTFSDPMTPVDLFIGRVRGGVTKTDPRKLDLRPKTRLSFRDYENLINSPVSLVPPGCDLDKGVEEYRITLPLMGAVSSPCRVNLAMRGNAEDHQHEFSPEVFSTALKNLFLDDSLKSLASRNESIKYECDLPNLMSTADFNLTKWVSNDRKILDSADERK